MPIARDGWRFIIPLALVGGGLIFLDQTWSLVLGGVCVALALFCLNFFRDFDRHAPIDPHVAYSPCDGKVVGVVETGPEKIIRVFLNVFDVHVQRSPVQGKVESVQYSKGTFLDARHGRAHLDNEKNTIVLSFTHGKVAVTQIAGLIARRILCWTKTGDALEQGQRYGLIRFGSQVNISLPSSAKLSVKVGDRVVGGKTVVARWA